MCALTFPWFNFPIHKLKVVLQQQQKTYKVQSLCIQPWRSRKKKKKKFSSIWMSQSSFKLLINWAIIMMRLWGWRNNLQVGEMRHEWLPSLTSAMLSVCVRSRQIPYVLSPSASAIGDCEHQLPPHFLQFFCRGPMSFITRLMFHGTTRSPCVPSLWGSRLGSCLF